MRTDTHAIKNATEATARGVLTARGINEKEAEAHAEATAEATVEAIVMSQQDLVTKQDLDVAVAGLRTEVKTDIAEFRAEVKTDNAELRTEMKTDNEKLRAEVKTDIAELRTEIARGNLKTIVYTATILGFFNAIVFSLITYFTQPRYVPLPLPLPLPGNQVQESQQVEQRIEQPEPRRLKPEQPESEQNQREGN